jgi:hypothetical protein
VSLLPGTGPGTCSNRWRKQGREGAERARKEEISIEELKGGGRFKTRWISGTKENRKNQGTAVAFFVMYCC